jgi:hypothetical protein
VPLYANSKTKHRVTFRIAFDAADAAFVGLLTACSFIAVTIGGARFSGRALLFLLAMNAISLAVGRALLSLDIRVFRRFAEYVLGFTACSLIVFLVCRAIAACQLTAAFLVRYRYGSWMAAGAMWLIICPFGSLLGYIDCFYLPCVLVGIFTACCWGFLPWSGIFSRQPDFL